MIGTSRLKKIRVESGYKSFQLPDVLDFQVSIFQIISREKRTFFGDMQQF